MFWSEGKKVKVKHYKYINWLGSYPNGKENQHQTFNVALTTTCIETSHTSEGLFRRIILTPPITYTSKIFFEDNGLN